MIGCQIEFEVAGSRGMRSVFLPFPPSIGMHIRFSAGEGKEYIGVAENIVVEATPKVNCWTQPSAVYIYLTDVQENK